MLSSFLQLIKKVSSTNGYTFSNTEFILHANNILIKLSYPWTYRETKELLFLIAAFIAYHAGGK